MNPTANPTHRPRTTGAQRAAMAARALLDRRRARRNLDDWARTNGFEPAKHHRVLNQHLEAAARRDIRRLMIWMPPGSAKSTYTSMLFPPWWMHQWPGGKILSITHKDSLVRKWGRICRNRVRDYRGTLNLQLVGDQRAATKWETATGGEYNGCGIFGAPSGLRADLILLDDPVRGREAADSELQREKLVDVYRDEIYTRLKPGGVVIVIQTRWHPMDLSGQLLADEMDDGLKWHVLSMPAIYEGGEPCPIGRSEGEALWPEWQSLDELRQIRHDVGERAWNALFQQRPRPDEGAVWKESYLRYFHYGPGEPTRDGQQVIPDGGNPVDVWVLYRFCTADLALGKRDGDFTVLCVWGYDSKTGILYLLHMDRGRYSAPETQRRLRALYKKWRLARLYIESVQYQTSVVQHLREDKLPATELIPDADKKTRLLAAEPWGEQRRLCFNADAANTPYLVHELLSFMGVGDEQDDCVDNISMGTMVARSAGTSRNPYHKSGNNGHGGNGHGFRIPTVQNGPTFT